MIPVQSNKFLLHLNNFFEQNIELQNILMINVHFYIT